MTYRVIKPEGKPEALIHLPASKSISNRVLLIQALCDKTFNIDHLSAAEDTQVMNQLLETDEAILDVGHAGTAMRFLTAYFAGKEGARIITGSSRMKQRPIGVLVDVLKELGAAITYLENEGYPPLKIEGQPLKGGTVELRGDVSSQFISALLMIAPALEKGLELKLTGGVVSPSYIRMTLEVMRYFGIEAVWKGDRITVPPGEYEAKDFYVEPDWSSASYWYEIAALLPESKFTLAGVREDSVQGDEVVASLFEKLGVKSSFDQASVVLKNNKAVSSERFEYDCLNCPDLAQTLIVTCAALKMPARLTGLETLKLKETNRIAALQMELQKTGAVIEAHESAIEITGYEEPPSGVPTFRTYDDHRMAMSFAPLALCFDEVLIEDPGVVSKSYPTFWHDLQKAGFEISIIN